MQTYYSLTFVLHGIMCETPRTEHSRARMTEILAKLQESGAEDITLITWEPSIRYTKSVEKH